MDDAQGMSSDTDASEVMNSLGAEPTEVAEEGNTSDAEGNEPENTDPLYVQKRLKQQKRAHDREIREMQARIESMQNSGGNPNNYNSNMANPNDYSASPGSVDEQIHKAVSYALGYRDREERKAKEAQSAQHIQKQYMSLQKHLDKVADKYDDFDEVVRGNDTPITPHMRDAALFLDMDHRNPGNAGEVFYKLAKNPDELERISKLHPLEQAKEMVKLSRALGSGGESKVQSPKIMGQVKNSPVSNSNAVNEKTSISSLRERMKSGSFK